MPLHIYSNEEDTFYVVFLREDMVIRAILVGWALFLFMILALVVESWRIYNKKEVQVVGLERDEEGREFILFAETNPGEIYHFDKGVPVIYTTN